MFNSTNIQVEQKSPAEVEDLWHEYIRSGDQQVRSQLVTQYLPLVKYIAGRITGNLPQTISWDDLFHSGVVGLIEAVDRYDPTQNVKFKTFAYPRIHGAMVDVMRRIEWGPRSLRDNHRKIEAAIEQLTIELGEFPQDEDIAAFLDVSIDDYYKMLDNVSKRYMLSLDYFYGEEEDENYSIEQTVEQSEHDNPLDGIVKEDEKDRLVQMIEDLPDQEKLVIALYYYEELTLREIGEVLDLSESRISQIHTKILVYLENELRN
jgi:RNA polymerase sigma factor for flagellar operon FliA